MQVAADASGAYHEMVTAPSQQGSVEQRQADPEPVKQPCNDQYPDMSSNSSSSNDVAMSQAEVQYTKSHLSRLLVLLEESEATGALAVPNKAIVEAIVESPMTHCNVFNGTGGNVVLEAPVDMQKFEKRGAFPYTELRRLAKKVMLRCSPEHSTEEIDNALQDDYDRIACYDNNFIRAYVVDNIRATWRAMALLSAPLASSLTVTGIRIRYVLPPRGPGTAELEIASSQRWGLPAIFYVYKRLTGRDHIYAAVRTRVKIDEGGKIIKHEDHYQGFLRNLGVFKILSSLVGPMLTTLLQL